MDLGCGKGADIRKFSYENISGYVGIDVSMGQLIDALNRRISAKYNFPTLFIKQKGQASPEEFNKNLPKNVKFNIISAQFCIHYFFESEHSVKNFLENISSNLSKDGMFIATFPDSKVIAKKFLKSTKVDPVSGMKYIENDYYSVVTNVEDLEKLKTAFGNKYGFFLEDGLIGSKYTQPEKTTKYHIPEYLVLSDYFIQMAKQYNLEVVIDQNFHKFFSKNVVDYFQMFQKIGFKKQKNAPLMDEQLWECSYLYKVLILKKTDGQRINSEHQRFEKDNFWEIIDEEDLFNI